MKVAVRFQREGLLMALRSGWPGEEGSFLLQFSRLISERLRTARAKGCEGRHLWHVIEHLILIIVGKAL